MKSFTQNLDHHQKEVVLHTLGPILVLAGAGSGKTRVLTHRIARLITEKVCAPDQILAVTFTNKAAHEMRERMAQLLTPNIAKEMTVSTFHSFGARVLREQGTRIGLPPGFTILDDNDRMSTLKSVMRFSGKSPEAEDRHAYATAISLAKNGSLDHEQYIQKNPDEVRTHRIFKAYSAALQKRHSIDFDDLLLLPLKILRDFPDVTESYRKRYHFISVDEFQDTNCTQMEIVKLLAAPRNNVMVVGDDDQSIYSWRGAEIENILSFSSLYKGCKVVILDRNYRSTPAIVDGAAAVIGCNLKRKPKKVTAVSGETTPIITFKADDEKEEIAWILQTISKNQTSQQYAYNDHALLFRTNTLIARFEEELRIQRIPYVVQGAMSFFDRKEIKDILAYLRFFANPHDELSLGRILKVPNKGITKTTLEKVEELAGRRKTILWEAFLHYKDLDGIEPGQLQKLESLVGLYHHYDQAFKNESLSGSARKLLEECGYMELLKNSYKNDPSLPFRLENIEQVISGIESYERRAKNRKPDLAGYLHEAALFAQDDPEENKNKKGVILMTIHKAKGLEFPVVFLPILDDAIFPSPKSCEEGRIEEERRLFYVAMTRARKKLILSYPQLKTLRKKSVPVKPCRFLNEIPQEFLDGKFGEKQDQEYSAFSQNFFEEMKKKLAPKS